MILISCGTHEQPFNRLLKKVDGLVGSKKIKEKVIAQIGYSTYLPKNIGYFRFTSFDDMEKLINSSRLVITHGGIGSIFLALRKRKKTIVVPRMKRFGEHSDDHQVQIVRELEKQKMIIGVYNIENLEEAIKRSKNFSFRHIHKKNIIVNKIGETLSKWEKLFTTF
jgi:UDP-N-acetylglucosamine transferase subunit ALG13